MQTDKGDKDYSIILPQAYPTEIYTGASIHARNSTTNSPIVCNC